MKICLAGEGAQADTHMKALAELEGIEVVALAGGLPEDMAGFAAKWNIPFHSLSLKDCLDLPEVEAVILTTPSQQHVEQVELAVGMGKHVQVEIPIALNYQDAQRLAALARSSGLTCMVSHTRHFNQPLRWLKDQISCGQLQLHHIVMETYFFRRENINRFGQPRTWKDDLLWHHGCHSADLALWLLDELPQAWGQTGPNHAELGIPMDLTMGMKSANGTLVSAALSFNHHGPFIACQRYIGEQASYTFEGGVLTRVEDGEVMAFTNMQESVVLQNQEFFAAIAEGRQPETNFDYCARVMDVLDRVEKSIDQGTR